MNLAVGLALLALLGSVIAAAFGFLNARTARASTREAALITRDGQLEAKREELEAKREEIAVTVEKVEVDKTKVVVDAFEHVAALYEKLYRDALVEMATRDGAHKLELARLVRERILPLERYVDAVKSEERGELMLVQLKRDLAAKIEGARALLTGHAPEDAETIQALRAELQSVRSELRLIEETTQSDAVRLVVENRRLVGLCRQYGISTSEPSDPSR